MSPFSKTEFSEDSRSIKLYGKKDATWAEMNAWLEENYGDGGKDTHWKWKGFGQAGSEDFCVVLFRQGCSEWLCGADKECENCGVMLCELAENDDGEQVCPDCYEQDEESDNDE